MFFRLVLYVQTSSTLLHPEKQATEKIKKTQPI